MAAPTKIDRTMTGLRDALLDEWDALRAGRGDIKQATAAATLARQVLASVKIEVMFAQHARGIVPGEAIAMEKPLRIGKSAR